MRTLRVPGDKSISHRALMLAALGRGTSRVRGLLQSADIESTAGVLRALGVSIPALDATELVIEGVGLRGLKEPLTELDCGNSGTTVRLMAGVVAGAGLKATFVGDESLSRRPMRRVAGPLSKMRATVALPEGDHLPMRVHGWQLEGCTHHLDVPSAQVKSAILLAGLVSDVPVEVHEPTPTRDHTERMLRARGVDVRNEENVVSLIPRSRLEAADTEVPGDPSSAAFLAGFAALGGAGAGLSISDVCVNPLRTGAFRALKRMGAELSYTGTRESDGDAVATVVVKRGALRAIALGGAEIPSLIDELPLLACVAARAEGETRVTGAAELRVKESDRIRVVVDNLRAIGADAEELPDGFIVRGSDKPLKGRVATHGDHRIAMAFGVLAALKGNAIDVDDPSCVAVSYPSFWDDLRRLA